MISDRDIYRTANLLLQKYGRKAQVHAAMRVDEYQNNGDLDGQRTWLRIIRAIEDLRATDRGKAPLH